MSTAAPQYRLLSLGDIVQNGDEWLQDDAVTWVSTPPWAEGMAYTLGIYTRPARRLITQDDTSGKVRFTRLSLGTLFQYRKNGPIWVVLSTEDCGLVAENAPGRLDYIGQRVCSAADSPEALASLEVYPKIPSENTYTL